MPRILSTLILLTCSAHAFGQDGKEPSGIVQELDAINGTITVILGGGPKARVERVRTFNLLKPDIPVSDATGRPLKLSDIQVDDRVFLKLMDDDIVGLRLAPPTWFGTLEQVNPAARTILLKRKIGDKLVTVSNDTKIFDHNQPALLAELKLGTHVLVVFAPDQKSVLELRTGKGQMPVTQLTKTTGVLIDLDRDKAGLHVFITSLGGDHSLLRALTFAKDASFALLYHSKPFRELDAAEMRRGLRVHFWSDVVTRKVVHLDAEMPILARRLVKAVDPQARRLTLEDPEGDKVLTLATAVKVLGPEGAGHLDAVQPQTVVTCGLSPDRKQVELLQIVGK